MKKFINDAEWVTIEDGKIKVGTKTLESPNALQLPLSGTNAKALLDSIGWSTEFLRDSDYIGFKVSWDSVNGFRIFNETTNLNFSIPPASYGPLGYPNNTNYNNVIVSADSIYRGYMFKGNFVTKSKIFNLRNSYYANYDYRTNVETFTLYPLNALVELTIEYLDENNTKIKEFVFTNLYDGAQIDSKLTVKDRVIITQGYITNANIYVPNETVF